MEKKLAVIVDNNKEITTEVANTEMCSSACDVAMETCSLQSHGACGSRDMSTKGEIVELLESHRDSPVNALFEGFSAFTNRRFWAKKDIFHELVSCSHIRNL